MHSKKHDGLRASNAICEQFFYLIYPLLSPSGIAATILCCHEPLERLGEASHVGADLVDVVAEADDVGLERAPVQSQEVQLRAGKDKAVPEMI